MKKLMLLSTMLAMVLVTAVPATAQQTASGNQDNVCGATTNQTNSGNIDVGSSSGGTDNTDNTVTPTPINAGDIDSAITLNSDSPVDCWQTIVGGNLIEGGNVTANGAGSG